MIEPLLDYILIEPKKETDMKTSTGILLPDTAKERPQEGLILAVGEDAKLKVGDSVYYKKWGGNEIKVGGKDLLLVKEEDVLAVIREDE